MTFEELKAEAKRQGYGLIKKRQYIGLQKCPICGKKPQQWISGVTGKTRYKCECGDATEWCSADWRAREAWNEAVLTKIRVNDII